MKTHAKKLTTRSPKPSDDAKLDERLLEQFEDYLLWESLSPYMTAVVISLLNKKLID